MHNNEDAIKLHRKKQTTCLIIVVTIIQPIQPTFSMASRGRLQRRTHFEDKAIVIVS